MPKHYYGTLESMKFSGRREPFYQYIDALKKMDVQTEDYLEHFPAFVGHMSLHRVLTLYNFYRQTLDVAGHIAEVGVFKGAISILFAKLVLIHEHESLTMVHGFDWFEGNRPTKEDSSLLVKGGYKADYEDVINLIKLQGLDHILKIHKIDVAKELEKFFRTNDHLRFKLVFLDAGLYKVVKACVTHFYDRLTPGGIMVFDQFNHEQSPGETLAITQSLPNAKIKTIPNSWMPNAYIVKE
jgi:hypothetical protein